MTSISFSSFSISTTALAASRPRPPTLAALAPAAEPTRPWPAERQGVLADAMMQALSRLGWTAPTDDVSAAAPAADTAVAAAEPAAAAHDLGDAVAAFAHALWGALRDGRGGDGEGRESRHHHHEQDHDNGRRAHGWGRNENGYRGLVPRLERLIAGYADASRAPAAAPVAPAPAATTTPTPAPEAMPVEPVDLPVPAPAPAAVDAAAPAPEAAAAEAEAGPVSRDDALLKAFEGLIAALREGGVGVPADSGAQSSMVDFLRGLTDALRPSPLGSSAGSQMVVTGSFIRISG